MKKKAGPAKNMDMKLAEPNTQRTARVTPHGVGFIM